MLRRGFLGLALLGFAAGGSALASTVPARATIADSLSLRALVHRADAIGVVTALRSEAHYDARGRIVTDIEATVDELVHGRGRVGDLWMVRRLGGVVGDVGMRVSGVAHLTVGRRYLVFLNRGGDGHLHSVGMAQGTMRIEPGAAGPMVHPSGAGLELVGGPAALTGPRPLEDVLAEVRRLLNRRNEIR